MVGQSLPSPLGVKVMRVGGGNGELHTPAPERVAWRVSLLPWCGLLLGKCTLLIISAGLEDTEGVRKVSPIETLLLRCAE